MKKHKITNVNIIGNDFAYRMYYAMMHRGMNGADMTRKAAGYGMNLGSSTISQYLSGKYAPKQDKIVLISRILGVPELWLMGLTPLDDIEGINPESYANPSEAEILHYFRSVNKNGKEFVTNILRTIANTEEYKKKNK